MRQLREVDPFSDEQFQRTEFGLYVPLRPRRRYSLPTCVDLFAGCGGFSCGMHQGGFHVVGAVEMDYAAAMTYMVNLSQPGVKIHFDTPEREEGFDKFLKR